MVQMKAVRHYFSVVLFVFHNVKRNLQFYPVLTSQRTMGSKKDRDGKFPSAPTVRYSNGHYMLIGISFQPFFGNKVLPCSLTTDAFNKFHDKPNFSLKSAGSSLSRRSNMVLAIRNAKLKCAIIKRKLKKLKNCPYCQETLS